MKEKRTARLWPVMGILATLAMWGVSALANAWAGAQYGTDAATQYLWGGASLSADVAKAALIFALTWAIASRQWVVTGVACVALALCVTWSVRSAVMFSSSQIQQAMAIKQHGALLVKDKRELVRLRSQRAAYLSAQDIKLPGSGKPLREALVSERKRTSQEFERLVQGAEKALRELNGASPLPPKDPIAEMLGIEEWMVLIPTVILFSLMVEFLSATGFWIISQSRMLPTPVPAHVSLDRVGKSGTYPPLDEGGGPPSGGGVVLPEAQQSPVALSAQNVTRLPKQKKSASRSQSKGRGALELLGPQINREAAKRYVADPLSRIALAEVHREVVSAIPALKNDVNPARCRHAVRHVLAEALQDVAGAEKAKIGGQYYFVGIRRASGFLTEPLVGDASPRAMVSA